MDALFETARKHEHLALTVTAIANLVELESVAYGVADHELGDAAAAASRELLELLEARVAALGAAQ